MLGRDLGDRRLWVLLRAPPNQGRVLAPTECTQRTRFAEEQGTFVHFRIFPAPQLCGAQIKEAWHHEPAIAFSVVSFLSNLQLQGRKEGRRPCSRAVVPSFRQFCSGTIKLPDCSWLQYLHPYIRNSGYYTGYRTEYLARVQVLEYHHESYDHRVAIRAYISLHVERIPDECYSFRYATDIDRFSYCVL